MSSARHLLALARLMCKSLFRQPLVVVSVLFFIIFVYVFTVGRQTWDEHHKYIDPVESDIAAKLREQTLLEFQIRNESTVKPTEPHLQPEVQPSDDDQDVPFEMAQQMRLDRIKRECSSPDRRTGFVNSLIGTQHNLTYCMIPRTANTFWLQMLRYSHGDYMENEPKSPMDLDTRQVRTRPFIRIKRYNWKMMSQVERSALQLTKIFVSVQDPYWRLWSTYLNAITLPELWQTIGLRIESRRPPEKVPVKKRGATKCGNTVTFAEFVEYTLKAYEPDLQPFYHQCNPCTLPLTYVVKSETAKRDNRFILSHLNLTWAIDLPDLEEKMREKYIRTLVTENAQRRQDMLIDQCTTWEHLAKRLWHAFVLQGIIPDTSVIPEGMVEISEEKLINEVINATRTSGDESINKRKYMVAAFRHLSPDTLKAVQEKFDMDFRFFGYDPKPRDIYENL